MVEIKSIGCNSIESIDTPNLSNQQFRLNKISKIKSIECNSIESIDTPNLKNQKFRLNKISEIEEYFIAEIKERELISKKLSKYIPFFDYFDKSLIVLSVRSGGVSITSFATAVGAPIGITSTSQVQVFVLHFLCVQD